MHRRSGGKRVELKRVMRNVSRDFQCDFIVTGSCLGKAGEKENPDEYTPVKTEGLDAPAEE